MSKDAPLLRDLIMDTLSLIEENKKALAPGGFELVTSRLRECCSYHFATTTASVYKMSLRASITDPL